MASPPTGPASPPCACPTAGAALTGGGARISGHDLLAWRRRLRLLGGRAADFDWLLDLAGGLGRGELEKLILCPERQVSLPGGQARVEALWRRHLLHGEPLQYLVGVCPWRDLELAVAPGVLIPRQETELLVDLALGAWEGDRPPGRWADLGTGSGCLAVALAQALPASCGLAVDLSEEALRQAGANLASHGLAGRVQLLAGDWWRALEPWWGQLELVVANPPYIPTGQLAELEPVVRDHEPRLALDGGADGLVAIRRLIAEAPAALAPGGLLLIEHHHDQSTAVLALLRQAGLERAQPHRDLEGVVRFALAWRAEGQW
jgi:release factor glutamine methyltransferase